jgi:hypothetical protein
VAVGVVLLSVLFVAAVAASAGPVQLRPGGPFEYQPPPREPLDRDLPGRPVPQEGAEVPEGDVTFLIVGFLVLATVMAVALLARLLRAMREAPDVATAATAPVGLGAPPPTGIADRLRDAADEAALALRSAVPGQSRDAVISCWLRLEAAAAEAGAPRDAAATPTQFTAALLTAHHAEPAAVRDLLGLYHRARFGRMPLPDDAGDRALAAVEHAAASMRTPAPGEPAPAVGPP